MGFNGSKLVAVNLNETVGGPNGDGGLKRVSYNLNQSKKNLDLGLGRNSWWAVVQTNWNDGGVQISSHALKRVAVDWWQIEKVVSWISNEQSWVETGGVWLIYNLYHEAVLVH